MLVMVEHSRDKKLLNLRGTGELSEPQILYVPDGGAQEQLHFCVHQLRCFTG